MKKIEPLAAALRPSRECSDTRRRKMARTAMGLIAAILLGGCAIPTPEDLAADRAAALDRERPVLVKTAADAAPARTADPAAGVAAVTVVDARGPGQSYRRSEIYSIDVHLDRDAHLYCYLIDEARQVFQFFPAPASPTAMVRGGERIRLPGSMPFRLYASGIGAQETIACYATSRELGAAGAGDLSAIRDLQALNARIRQLQGGADFGLGVLNVKPD
jgi:hypothetical protein